MCSVVGTAQVRGHIPPRDSRGPCKVNHWVIDAAIGRDTAAEEEGRHSMCLEGSPHCVKPRSARTEMVLLQHGLYQKDPVSKVLLIPRTGRENSKQVCWFSKTIIF